MTALAGKAGCSFGVVVDEVRTLSAAADSSVEKISEGMNTVELADRLDRSDDPGFTLKPLSQHIDQLYQGYVMSSQRETHQASMQQQSGKLESAHHSGPKIELF